MRFVVVSDEGFRVKECANDGFLASAQEAVGGLIECFLTVANPNAVTPKHKLTAYANEEGLYLFTAENAFRALTEYGDVRGPVVFAGLDDENGMTLSLSDEDITFLRSRIGMVATINLR